MTRVRTAFVAVLLTACVVTGQEPKKDTPGEPEPARLDLKSLGVMLTDLGVEPKLLEDYFQKVRWTTPNWGSPVWLSVTSDKKTVWLYTEFDLRADYMGAPAAAWLKLLEKNDAIGPTYFALDEKGKRLALRRPVPNAGVTGARLRKELNSLVETVYSTRDLWAAAAFLPPLSADGQKVVDQLAGKWKLASSVTRGVALPPETLAKYAFEFEGSTLRATVDGKEALKSAVFVEIVDGQTRFDFISATGTDYGILKIDGDTATLCSSLTGVKNRPSEFKSTDKAENLLMVLKRQKP